MLTKGAKALNSGVEQTAIYYTTPSSWKKDNAHIVFWLRQTTKWQVTESPDQLQTETKGQWTQCHGHIPHEQTAICYKVLFLKCGYGQACKMSLYTFFSFIFLTFVCICLLYMYRHDYECFCKSIRKCWVCVQSYEYIVSVNLFYKK